MYIGAHRKAEGVLISVDAYRRFIDLKARAERAEWIASAEGSLRAEGLQLTAETANNAQDFINGEIDLEELLRRTIARHSRV